MTERSAFLRTPAVVAWLRLTRAYAKVERTTADFLRSYDLSVAQFDALAQIDAAEGCTQRELADRLFVTKGNVSQLLERLEQRRLIERRPRGRAYCLHLTDDGRRLAALVVPAQEELIARLFGGLLAEEQRQLWLLLRRLDKSLVYS